MNPVETYIPIDRRFALANNTELPQMSSGAVLFVDISGFTPFTGALVQQYGTRRGAEELIRRLNHLYTVLIAEIERFQGSVIGFSGDAVACWFDRQNRESKEATIRAICAALSVQQTMLDYRGLTIESKLPHSRQSTEQQSFPLAVKTAIAAGTVRRFTVGDPTIQLIDVLAGRTLDRMAATEAMAEQNELLIDEGSVKPILSHVTIKEWRTNSLTGERYAHVSALVSSPAPAPWPPSPPIPLTLARSWVHPTIVTRLGEQQSRFLAELRPAAALFLRFTGLDFDHDPDSPQKLDQYIQWVQQIINQQEGALIQLTTGDKGSYLYATFGAPIAHDDDIQRAVAAALSLQTPPVNFPFIATTQIGITYGMMRVGAYGGDTRKTYGVLGTETNMAARLMTHAAPGQIVISEVVAEALSPAYEIVALGKHKLKGKAEPQPLFAVQGMSSGPTAQQKLYETKLVGREAELAELRSIAQQIPTGNGRVVRIEGSAGLGKSHLVAAFASEAETLSLRTIQAGGQSTTQGTAYFAIRQLMQKLLGLESQIEISLDERIALLRKRIEEINPQWTVRMPLLGDLLGIPIADNATTAAFDARLRQETLTTFLLEIILHFARTEPLLLILEDIHWLDEVSQGIVLALGRIVTTAPILLLLIHRPSVRENEAFLTEVASITEQAHIPLQELPPLGIVALAEERLGGSIAPLAVSLIQIQAQGNPFFTEELVDALLETGQLQQKAGAWNLAVELVERLRGAGCLMRREGVELLNPDRSLSSVDLGIPTTIQGIILARLDRLPESIKLTVKVASVIGRVFGYDLLQQAHPLPVEQTKLDQELEMLLAREFARLEAPAPRPTYIFKHNITQEVVYQTLLTDQRQELHLGVATALESTQPERVEDLANHYYSTDLEEQSLRTKALHYLEAAGLRAKYDYANETALRYYDRALGLEERAIWLKAKVEILHILGRREEEHTALATLAAHDSDFGDVALLQGSYFEAISDYDEAQQHLEQALRYHQEHENLRGKVQSLSQLALILVRQANYDDAKHLYQNALKLSESYDVLNDERASLLYGLSVVNRQQGNYAEARTQLEAALALHQATNNRQGEAQILTALGAIAYMQRDYPQAEAYYQASLSSQQIIGNRAGEGGCLMSLGQVSRSHGDYGKAADLIEKAMAIFRAQGNLWWEKIGSNELGIIAMVTGQFATAAQYFENSGELSRLIGDAVGEAIAMLNLGQTTRDLKDYCRAKELIIESRTIADQLGDKDLAAQCWSDLALCELLLHAPTQAITCAQHASALFTELGIQQALITELCTLAQAYLQLGDRIRTNQKILEAYTLLEEFGSDGLDYPQREYFTCYRIFEQLGDPEIAVAALNKAHQILQSKAADISEPTMRQSFLQNVDFNRQIIAAMAGKPLPHR